MAFLSKNWPYRLKKIVTKIKHLEKLWMEIYSGKESVFCFLSKEVVYWQFFSFSRSDTCMYTIRQLSNFLYMNHQLGHFLYTNGRHSCIQ